MKKWWRRLVVGIFALGLFSAVWASSALAAKYIAESEVSNANIDTKAQMTATYLCFKNGGTTGSITPAAWAYNGKTLLGTAGTTYVWDSQNYSLKGVACSALFSNADYKPSAKVPVKNAGQDTLDSFFKDIGYEKVVTGTGNGYCATYNFEHLTVSGVTATAKLCAPGAEYDNGTLIVGAGRINTAVEVNDPSGKVTIKPVAFANGNGGSISNLGFKLFCNLDDWYQSLGLGDSGTFIYGRTTDAVHTKDFVAYTNEIYNAMLSYYEKNGAISGEWRIVGGKAEVEVNGGTTTYVLTNDNRAAAALKAVRYFFGDNSITSETRLALSTVQQKNLLTDILNNYFKVAYFGGSQETACGNLGETEKNNAESHGYATMKINKTTTCYVKATEHDGNNVKLRLFNKETGLLDGTMYSFKEILQLLTELLDAAPAGVDLDVDIDATIIGEPTPPDPIDSEDVNTLALCYEGAGVLGWIACPVLEVVGGATSFIYDHWIDPALEIKASQIMVHGGATYEGWSAFRNVANVLFAVLFLVVILSQVTGYGLDNYSVKKILPRLIMVAVLVNISFILCQLAVDVSNLLGVGMRNIFEKNLPVGTTDIFEGYNAAGTIAGGLFASVLSYLGLGFGAVKITGFVMTALGANLMWFLVPFILGFLACLVSVLFFFTMLGVRQAGIIVLVVLSPVAIVCYALPNTKGFFDKWRKLFQALLMVYPICGVLMGGGNYAGSLLLTIGAEASQNQDSIGVFYILTAMLVTVVPFFFVPIILKSSMLAMGNLGMRMSNLGKRWGAGIQRVKTTEGYQAWQKDRKIALNQARIRGIDKSIDPKSLANRFRSKVPFLKAQTELSKRKSLQRNRYAAENRRLLEEYATAQANAKRPAMQYGNDEFNTEVENIRTANVNRSAAAKEAAWNSSGLVDQFDTMGGYAYESLDALTQDFSNEDARSKLLASSKILEASEPGHEALIHALRRAEYEAYKSGDAGRIEAFHRAARWLANAGLSRSGSKLKEESPILNAMYKRLQKNGKRNEETGEMEFDRGEITAKTDGDGNIIRDRNGLPVGYESIKDVSDGFSKITPNLMPGMDENELNQAYDIIRQSRKADAQPEIQRLGAQLAGAASQVFSNDQIAKGVKTKEGAIIQRMANFDLASTGITSKEQVAKVSEADLLRIETGLNNNMIKDEDSRVLLDRLEGGVKEAASRPDFNGMTSNKAQIINRILEAHRGDFVSRLGIDSEKYKDLLQRDFRIDRRRRRS